MFDKIKFYKHYDMQKQLTLTILTPYLAPDRPLLKDIFPFEHNGRNWHVASNPHSIIMIAQYAENRLPPPDHAFPNLLAIIPAFNCQLQIRIEDLNETYFSIPLVNQEVTYECETCNGDGTFTHDGFDYDCKTCNETGKIKTGRLEKAKDPAKDILINGIPIDSKHVYMMLNVIKQAGVSSVTLRHSSENKPLLFELDDTIMILIAQKHYNDENPRKETVAVKIHGIN